jgi:hypothetical protein
MFFWQTELDGEAIEKAGLAQKAEARAFRDRREPSENRELGDSAKRDFYV